MFLIIFILLFERLLSEYYITNYTTSITITGLSCQVPNFNKTDCAPSGHTNPTSCEQSGCCYEAILYDTTIPWCFYGVSIPTTIITTIPTTLITTIINIPTQELNNNNNSVFINKCSYKLELGSYEFYYCNNEDVLDNLNLFIKEYPNDGENIIFKLENNYILQLTNEEYELNCLNGKNENKYNLSIIELNKCQKLLKEAYNINENKSLIILKYEKLTNNSYEKNVEYEVYSPSTKRKLNLNICKNVKIDINIPSKLDENNLFKYNSSSEYYNDICFPHTTKDNTDIIINDRRKEYIDNNMILCEQDCEYNGYDIDNKNIKCECNVKIKFELTTDINIEIDKNELINRFKNIENLTNILVIKCYKLFFCKDGLIKNIGSYILLIIIVINIILLILYFKKGNKEMNYIVKAVVKSKKDTKDISKNDKIISEEKTKNKNKKNVKFKRNSVTVINKNNNLNIIGNNNNEEEKRNKDNKPNKRQSVIIPKNPPKIKKQI